MGPARNRGMHEKLTHKLRAQSFNFLRWTEYELVEFGVCVRDRNLNAVHKVTVEYDRVGKEAHYSLKRSGRSISGIAQVPAAGCASHDSAVNFDAWKRTAWKRSATECWRLLSR